MIRLSLSQDRLRNSLGQALVFCLPWRVRYLSGTLACIKELNKFLPVEHIAFISLIHRQKLLIWFNSH